jgi:hypothetical protein
MALRSFRALRILAQAGSSAQRYPAKPTTITTSTIASSPASSGCVAGPRLVLVASKNPVKVDAVERALQLCFPFLELSVQARNAPSGVPDQPRGDEETLAG